MKKFFLFFLFLTLPLTAADKPNIVLFLVDDMGWMDSSVYGSKYYDTPNMERLAKQSMRFTNAYAVPLCSPTRASILTGQYSARHGVTSASGHQPPAAPDASRYPEKTSPNKRFIYANSKNYLDPELVTLAEVLKEAGYRTGHFGKWHLGLTQPHWPDKNGFEETWHAAPDPGPPSYFSPYGVSPDGKPGSKNRVGNITDGPDGEYITDRLTDEAIAFIAKHEDEPFFLNLWQYGVHGPWGHKEEYTAEFARKTDPRGFQNNPIMASMLKSVDDSLGLILDELDARGLTENTLFIFFSDNGGNTHSNAGDDPKLDKIKPDHPKYEQIQDWRKWAGKEGPTNNAPLREGKGRIYEGGQRVPLMVRWPGHIEPDTVTDTLVGAIDLYPTILEALDIDKPVEHIVDGISLLPVLEKKGEIEREALFNWFPHLIPAVSVRRGDYKLIRRFEPHPQYPATRELYHLGDDIGETKNLAREKPELVADLDALIDSFIEKTGALAPKPNPDFKPQVAAQMRAPDFGLVPKMSKTTIVKGALKVEADGRTPFLGTGRIKETGPLKFTMRIKAPAGGEGKIHWKTADQEAFPEQDQFVDYALSSQTEWQDVKLDLPVEGTSGTIRMFVPADQGTIEIESIRFLTPEDDIVEEWDFSEE